MKVIKYSDVLRKKTEKIENEIKKTKVKIKQIQFNLIQSICEEIISQDYTINPDLDPRLLKNLQHEINKWLQDKNKKETRSI